jgi:hypothetical protein
MGWSGLMVIGEAELVVTVAVFLLAFLAFVIAGGKQLPRHEIKLPTQSPPPIAQRDCTPRVEAKDTKWGELYKELEDKIAMAKADASNIDLPYEAEQRVKDHLLQASLQQAAAETEPGREEEHLQAGFHHVGQARGIFGRHSVQSRSFRRYQWPFGSPGTD